MRATRVKTVRALERGLAVLLRLHEARAASLNDLHRSTGLARATLTRILLTMERQGLVWQRIADGAYLPSHSLQMHARHPDETDSLVEVASPVLEELCGRIRWPSILAVPRLHYMEVIETNSRRSYFDHIPLGPIGFRINMLRSATGRTYLAFCDAKEREAVLERLRASNSPGDAFAHDRRWVARVLAETRRRGYGVREPGFGGHYDRPRREVDDGRNSIAVPIVVGGTVIGCLNLTWLNRVTTVGRIVEQHLPALQQAASRIAGRMDELSSQARG